MGASHLLLQLPLCDVLNVLAVIALRASLPRRNGVSASQTSNAPATAAASTLTSCPARRAYPPPTSTVSASSPLMPHPLPAHPSPTWTTLLTGSGWRRGAASVRRCADERWPPARRCRRRHDCRPRRAERSCRVPADRGGATSPRAGGERRRRRRRGGMRHKQWWTNKKRQAANPGRSRDEMFAIRPDQRTI